MKNILSLSFVVILLIVFVGCGAKRQNIDRPNPERQKTVSSSEVVETESTDVKNEKSNRFKIQEYDKEEGTVTFLFPIIGQNFGSSPEFQLYASFKIFDETDKKSPYHLVKLDDYTIQTETVVNYPHHLQGIISFPLDKGKRFTVRVEGRELGAGKELLVLASDGFYQADEGGGSGAGFNIDFVAGAVSPARNSDE